MIKRWFRFLPALWNLRFRTDEGFHKFEDFLKTCVFYFWHREDPVSLCFFGEAPARISMIEIFHNGSTTNGGQFR